jgi:hypothetical protein
MIYYSRALFSGRQKLVYTIAAVLVATAMVLNPRIVEGILIFCLTGEVPGTKLVLSPDIVIALVAGALVLITSFAVLRFKIRRHQIRRSQTRIPVRIVTERVIPVMDASTPMPVAVEYTESAHPVLHKRHRISGILRPLIHTIADGTALIGKGLATMLRAILIAAVAVVLYAWSGIVVATKFAYRANAVLWMGLARLVVAFWNGAKPRLQKFDTWLELQVRKLEAGSKRKLKRYEIVRTLTVMGREYRKSFYELSPKIILQESKHKITRARNRLADHS